MKVLSIIIPTYNMAALLPRCLVFDPQAPFDLPDTDYREVETRIAELRRHSMEYIRRQLGNTDQIT